jgi:hypothetical protein
MKAGLQLFADVFDNGTSIFLCSADGAITELDGPELPVFLETVVPLLDGTRRADEIAAELPDYDAESVLGLLEALHCQGFLVTSTEEAFHPLAGPQASQGDPTPLKDDVLPTALQAAKSRIQVRGQAPDGFVLYAGYVSVVEQRAILRSIEEDVATWQMTPNGHPAATYVEVQGGLPSWARSLGERMVADGILSEHPDYAHLKRYAPGRGIPPHIDINWFEHVAAGLTLGSSRVFELTRPADSSKLRALLLPGDLYVMTGEASSEWLHSIPNQEIDEFRGRSYPRANGVSVTWRIMTQAYRRSFGTDSTGQRSAIW